MPRGTQVRIGDSTLTRFAGAIPLIKFINESLELPARLAAVVDCQGRSRIFAIHNVLLAFLVGSLIGVERLAHLEWLRGDAVLLKFLRMPAWPVRKVFSAALAGLSAEAVSRLKNLLTAFGMGSVDTSEGVVLDFDSSTIVSLGKQEGAFFGYCGKGRSRRRHPPRVASVAASRAVIHADYRDGSAITAQEAISFFSETVRRVRGVDPGCLPTLRADSGFWSVPMGGGLLEEGLPFVMSHPLHAAVKLMLCKATWKPLEEDPDIDLATLPGEWVGLDPRLRIVAVRRFVHDEKAPPQGKVIPNDPEWRYQALVTSMDWSPLDTWRFYNGRADCERVFKVAKGALGMNWLVSHDLTANNVAFLVRLLAFNVDVLFQQYLALRARSEGRPVLEMGLQSRQVRFYNGAGRWLREHNRWVLRIPDNARLAVLWSFHAPALLVRS
jgi:hypothetical protein